MSIKMVQMGRYKELTMRYIDVDSYGGIHEHKDGTDGKVMLMYPSLTIHVDVSHC
jgi:hypothetical protein